jgi:NADH-quinone oxidoreductase subunit M
MAVLCSWKRDSAAHRLLPPQPALDPGGRASASSWHVDLFLFFFFWEMMLVPMYFLIALWGHVGHRWSSHASTPPPSSSSTPRLSGLIMLVAILGLAADPPCRPPACFTFSYADAAQYAHECTRCPVPADAGLLPRLRRQDARWCHCTAGCRTPTVRRRPPARLIWPASCSRPLPMVCCALALPLFPDASAEFAPIRHGAGSQAASSTAPCWPLPRPTSSGWSPTPASPTWAS